MGGLAAILTNNSKINDCSSNQTVGNLGIMKNWHIAAFHHYSSQAMQW